jgi:hypothetical protein
MRDEPEWITKLKADPCRCVRCAECCGTGTIYGSEPCSMCRNGIIETCDRCAELDDYYEDADIL